MDLVTVVCDRDYNQMLLQAESIQKFLAPCKHWVVVNDEVPDVEFWQNSLSKYYTNHELVVIPYTDLFENTNNYIGHYTQQVCKLMIVKLIKEDYLILDAKNFFIKPTNTNEWDTILGSGQVEFLNVPEYNPLNLVKVAYIWKPTITFYKELLHVNMPDLIICPLTPFKVQADVLLNYEDLDLLYDLMSTWKYEREFKVKVGPSEFIFYSLLANDLIHINKNVKLGDLKRRTCWPTGNGNIHSGGTKYGPWPFKEFHNNFSPEDFKNKDISVLGFHHLFLKSCAPEHIKEINDWLSEMAFTFRF
jgi:hypothetical protein